MAAYLDQHPDIYFAERKEPFFFSTDLPHAKAVTDEADYLSLFAKGAARRYRAEGSTWYLYSKIAAAAIEQASPDARIIIMLRDPIDLIVSQYQYNLLNGNENLQTLEDALEAEPARLCGSSVPPSNRISAALHYTTLTDFAPQIERYRERFGQERVLILLFDDLAEDAASLVNETFDFLELDAMPNLDLAPANRTEAMTERRFGGLYRTMVTKRGLMGQAKRLLPPVVKRAVWNTVDGLNRAGTDRPKKLDLSPATRAQLATKLKPGVDRLAEMLGRDLSHWASAEPKTSLRARRKDRSSASNGATA